jgi:hypothetical protein
VVWLWVGGCDARGGGVKGEGMVLSKRGGVGWERMVPGGEGCRVEGRRVLGKV